MSEIRIILQENAELLSVRTQETNDSNFCRMEGIRRAMAAAENISHVPSLGQIAGEIIGIREVASVWTDEPVTIPKAIAEKFRSMLSRLKNECHVILALADSILPASGENYLCVRLSDSITDLSGLKRLVCTLEKAFQLTCGIQSYPGRVRFAGVEAGTNWINLIIEGAEYAVLVCILIKAAYEAVRDYYELEAMRKRHEGIQALSQIAGSNANMVQELNKSILSRRMEDGTLEDISAEEFARLCKASMEFSRIVMDGSKILLSIDAPKEKQNGILEVAKQIDHSLGEVQKLEGPKGESDSPPDGK